MVNKKRFQDQLDFPLNFTNLPPTPLHTDMGTFLVRSINCGFYNGELSIRQEGRFYLVPKDTKPKRYINNRGSMSLLNSAYKTHASACVANRLDVVLSKIIHEDQKGFMRK